MSTALAAVLGASVLVLAILLLGRFYGELASLRWARGPAKRRGEGSGSCPLCSSVLDPGERIKSDIFPGKGDRLMRIFGCPRCLPPLGREARICPVCGGALPAEGWVVARYFERPGRRHVHVLGCTSCHPAAGGPRRL